MMVHTAQHITTTSPPPPPPHHHTLTTHSATHSHTLSSRSVGVSKPAKISGHVPVYVSLSGPISLPARHSLTHSQWQGAFKTTINSPCQSLQRAGMIEERSYPLVVTGSEYKASVAVLHILTFKMGQSDIILLSVLTQVYHRDTCILVISLVIYSTRLIVIYTFSYNKTRPIGQGRRKFCNSMRSFKRIMDLPLYCLAE